MTTRRRARAAQPPRVVLDTNVLISALIFSRGPISRLRPAWQAGLFVPLASTATTLELMRVLTYPKFRLDDAAQTELLADYLPWTEAIQVSNPLPEVPACRDPLDLPFLHLAAAGGATTLVSGDADLLSLAGSPKPKLSFAIIAPAAFLKSLSVHDAP